MNTVSLALTLIAATGVAASAAVASYDARPIPSARAIEQPARQPAAPVQARLTLPEENSETCRQAVWPYIPAACIRNADAERLNRPVRIIRIDTATPVKAAPVMPAGTMQGRR